MECLVTHNNELQNCEKTFTPRNESLYENTVLSCSIYSSFCFSQKFMK